MAAKKRNWISKATENSHGQFASKAKAAGQSTSSFAAEHASDPGKTGQQARLAETLAGVRKRRSGKLYTNPHKG